MSAPRENTRPAILGLADAVRRNHDPLRPLLRAPVVDISLWAATGPAMVGVNLFGSRIYAAYRDMPAPSINQIVSVAKMNSSLSSDWLVLPMPLAGIPLVGVAFDATYITNYPSGATDLTDDEWLAIVGRDATGTWAIRANYPIDHTTWEANHLEPTYGLFDGRMKGQFPMRRCGDRLITWGFWERFSFNVTTDADLSPALMDTTFENAFYSDDWGYTWAVLPTLRAVRSIEEGVGGRLYAVHADGEEISTSTDEGATWTSLTTGRAPDGARWWQVSPDPVDEDTCLAQSSGGRYLTSDRFSTLDGPMGKWLYNRRVYGAPGFYDTQAYDAVMRTPGGTASLGYSFHGYPDEAGAGGWVVRQADPFPGSGNWAEVAGAHAATYAGDETTTFSRSPTRTYVHGPFGGYGLQWSDDEGATWTPELDVFGTYDPVWGPEAEVAGYTGIGVVFEGSDGDWYASRHESFSGLSWGSDNNVTPGYASPRIFRKVGGEAGVWQDETGDLFAQTGTIGTGQQYAFTRKSLVESGA